MFVVCFGFKICDTLLQQCILREDEENNLRLTNNVTTKSYNKKYWPTLKQKPSNFKSKIRHGDSLHKLSKTRATKSLVLLYIVSGTNRVSTISWPPSVPSIMYCFSTINIFRTNFHKISCISSISTWSYYPFGFNDEILICIICWHRLRGFSRTAHTSIALSL